MSHLQPANSTAFRHPFAFAGCSCSVCNRFGDTTSPAVYPSPYAVYRLEKWDAELGVQREPTDVERAEFNRLYPTMAYTRTHEDNIAADGSGDPDARTISKVETPWIKACLKVIRRLKKEKSAVYFQEPVDVVKYNLLDYYTIVKHPMDFMTIETKLLRTQLKQQSEYDDDDETDAPDADVYAGPEYFASDMRLVFRNSFIYNKVELDVSKCARTMSTMFEKLYFES